jgi:hypothetical protein
MTAPARLCQTASAGSAALHVEAPGPEKLSSQINMSLHSWLQFSQVTHARGCPHQCSSMHACMHAYAQNGAAQVPPALLQAGSLVEVGRRYHAGQFRIGKNYGIWHPNWPCKRCVQHMWTPITIIAPYRKVPIPCACAGVPASSHHVSHLWTSADAPACPPRLHRSQWPARC